MKNLTIILAFLLGINTTSCNRCGFTHSVEGDSDTITGIKGEASGTIIGSTSIQHKCRDYDVRNDEKLTRNYEFTYRIEDDYAVITGIEGEVSGEIVVPETILHNDTYYFVRKIDGAFKCQEQITEVVLPNTITAIGGSGFEYCTSLKKINIPTSLEALAGHLFDHCTSLDSIEIPSNIIRINQFAFNHCTNLKKVVIYKRIPIELKTGVFSGCDKDMKVCVQPSALSRYIKDASWQNYNITPLYDINKPYLKDDTIVFNFKDTIDETMTIYDTPVKVRIEYSLFLELPQINNKCVNEAILKYIFKKPISISDIWTEYEDLMVSNYIETWGNSENQFNNWDTYVIKAETDNYITYQQYNIYEQGGIHANIHCPFITIDKKDGHIVNRIFKDGLKVTDIPHIISKGLKQFYMNYYNCSEEELLNYDSYGFDKNIKYPSYEPALVGDSIEFQYHGFDGYGIDMPNFRIHVDLLRPYLSDEILQWIDK